MGKQTKGAGSKFWARFWGVRGSLPTPGPHTSKYGGNTACVEVRCGDQIFICDLGSGARPLGVELYREAPVSATVLISHYHWDHICGMPFCGILFDPRNSFEIYGEGRKRKGVKSILAGQMHYPYFPVGLEVLQAEIKYNTITSGETVKKGDVTIKSAPLNHPQSSLAYRIEYGGKSLVYCTDNEHQSEMPKKMEKIIRGCDVLIYDAAYTDDEYAGRSGRGPKVGWGHSTWEEAVRTAKHLRVKNLYIFHHDPMHSDKIIDELLRECRPWFKNLNAAREGKTVKLL